MSSSDRKRPAILGGAPIRTDDKPDWPRHDDRVIETIGKFAQSGDWGRYHGPHGPELCNRLSEYHGVEHVLLCSSGTAAVELALRGARVEPGDEVILAGYDFKANYQNILCLNAVPVLVDLSPTTWQMSPDRLANAITDRTRAIVASHLHGGIVDIGRIRQMIGGRSIAIIEDACQSPGAKVDGQRAGSLGDVGVISFGGSKLLTAGRGGAILTGRADIAERIKRYVHRGNDAYPLSEMQSAVLAPQLDQLDTLNAQRRETVEKLCERLIAFPGLTVLQCPTESICPAYYKVGFRYQAEEFDGLSRDQFVSSLRAEGIAIDAGFRGLHLIHASRRFRAADPLVEATKADAGMLTLHHPILLDGDRGIDDILIAVSTTLEYAQEILNNAV